MFKITFDVTLLRSSNYSSCDESISILDWTTNLTTDALALSQKRTSTPVQNSNLKERLRNDELEETFIERFHNVSNSKGMICIIFIIKKYNEILSLLIFYCLIEFSSRFTIGRVE